VTIIGPDKKGVETGALKQPCGAALVLPLRVPLSVGTYTVNWRVLCIDGEEINGSYKFDAMK
jgi:methionine-rich copper-binding protein CopC